MIKKIAKIKESSIILPKNASNLYRLNSVWQEKGHYHVSNELQKRSEETNIFFGENYGQTLNMIKLPVHSRYFEKEKHFYLHIPSEIKS